MKTAVTDILMPSPCVNHQGVTNIRPEIDSVMQPCCTTNRAEKDEVHFTSHKIDIQNPNILQIIANSNKLQFHIYFNFKYIAIPNT